MAMKTSTKWVIGGVAVVAAYMLFFHKPAKALAAQPSGAPLPSSQPQQPPNGAGVQIIQPGDMGQVTIPIGVANNLGFVDLMPPNQRYGTFQKFVSSNPSVIPSVSTPGLDYPSITPLTSGTTTLTIYWTDMSGNAQVSTQTVTAQ
jgi:hypothetical protein